jgi:flavorubredoxin
MRVTDKGGASGYQVSGEVAPGIHWFDLDASFDGFTYQLMTSDAPDWYEDHKGRKLLGSFNVYLIEGSEKSLLWDTGPILQENEIGQLIDDILDGDDLDYLAASHPCVDHTGSVRRLMEQYPDMTLLAPAYGETPEIYYMDQAERVKAGDTINLGDKQCTIRDSQFVDAAMTMWMTEDTTNTFFVVDWFAWSKLDNERHMFADEIIDEYGIDEVLGRKKFVINHKYNWFPYADPEVMKAHVDYMLEEYEPERLAPAHSPPMRKYVPEWMEGFKRLIDETIAEDSISGDLVAD